MKTTKPESSDLAQRVETAMHELSVRARSTPQRCRRLLHSRRNNALLRDLGELHYRAHVDGTEPDPTNCERILAALDEADADDE